MRSSRDLVEKVLFPEPFAPAITTRVGCGILVPTLDRFGAVPALLPCDLLFNDAICYDQGVKCSFACRLGPVRILPAGLEEDVRLRNGLRRTACSLRDSHCTH